MARQCFNSYGTVVLKFEEVSVGWGLKVLKTYKLTIWLPVIVLQLTKIPVLKVFTSNYQNYYFLLLKYVSQQFTATTECFKLASIFRFSAKRLSLVLKVGEWALGMFGEKEALF